VWRLKKNLSRHIFSPLLLIIASDGPAGPNRYPTIIAVQLFNTYYSFMLNKRYCKTSLLQTRGGAVLYNGVQSTYVMCTLYSFFWVILHLILIQALNRYAKTMFQSSPVVQPKYSRVVYSVFVLQGSMEILRFMASIAEKTTVLDYHPC
jgi:hypothetical protein